jgi:uncharacterized membrane protein
MFIFVTWRLCFGKNHPSENYSVKQNLTLIPQDITEEEAKTTAPLAQNMGLYNLFIGLGLFYSIYTGIRQFQLYFLLCVFVAGVVGALTVVKRIFFTQSVPAMIAILFFTLSG